MIIPGGMTPSTEQRTTSLIRKTTLKKDEIGDRKGFQRIRVIRNFFPYKF